ncbi:MAG: NAD-dependent malic enzyme [Gammaproteobacteria bacterium]|nr:NAD-dependent malic enzyme [Gammaproteobacteria bacterium]
MQKFELIRTDGRQQLKVGRRATSLLRFPLYNKGTGFTPEERERFRLDGLLPSQHNSIDVQAERVFKSIMFDKDPVGRHIGLAALQDRNEHLFYKVLSSNLEELMPIVYTPTVGKAAQYFSRVFRRARGIWITPEHIGRIESVLRNASPFAGVELMVVTDNESILGIGDQGAGGMAISVGKLALYCAGAGIHPARTLPISLDVGTDNQTLLDDPLYLGWREKRLRGERYIELVDEFVQAARSVFPNVVIQWEDLRKDNALAILDRYQNELPSFNDDIQGTGAVAVACVLAASRISGRPLDQQRIVIYGAGAAGLGISRELRNQFATQGVDSETLERAIIVMDSRGIVSDGRDNLDAYKKEMALPEKYLRELGIDDAARTDLTAIVKASQANVLIGASGQGGAFTEDTVRAMLDAADQPVILPMSNPTSISEAIPENILRWTGGRALVATGSPFDDVSMRGGPQRIGQANNVFIFPGLGLGTIISGATRVTGGMISASANALAENLTEQELGDRCLMPEVSRLWQVCEVVGIAVARQAVEDGVARLPQDIEQRLRDYRWVPEYPEFIKGDIDVVR